MPSIDPYTLADSFPKAPVYVASISDGTTDHLLTRVDSNDKTKRKLCAYCQLKKIKSGNPPKTPRSYFKCVTCDVPLCVNERGCFNLYHKLLQEGGIA